MLICLELGLLALGLFSPLPNRADAGFTTITVIALSLGTGVVVFSITAYRLSSLTVIAVAAFESLRDRAHRPSPGA